MSTLKARIQADIVPAMKARELARVATLRSMLAAIDNAEAVSGVAFAKPVVNERADVPRRILTDDEIRALLQREADERRDAIPAYESRGRAEDAERLRKEIAILSHYVS